MNSPASYYPRLIHGWVVVASTAFVCMIAALACQPAAGRFELHFDWPEDADAPDFVFLRARVEPASPEHEFSTLEVGPVGPVAFGAEVALPFSNVPSNQDLLVVVDVLEAASDDFVRYSGTSEPFRVSPNTITHVGVRLGLAGPPNQHSDVGAAELLLDGRLLADPIVISSSTVTIRVPTDTAKTILVSNNRRFTSDEATAAFDVADLERVETSCGQAPEEARCTYELEWNVDQGATDACEDAPHCDREISIRLLDARGLRSRDQSIRLTVDRRAPIPVLQQISPEVASAYDTIVVSLTFSEAIPARSARLVAEPPVGTMTRTFPESGDAQDNTLIFTLSPPTSGWGGTDEIYLFASASDQAGNGAGLLALPGVIHIDGIAPTIQGFALDPPTISVSRRSFEVQFELSEPVIAPQFSVGPLATTAGSVLEFLDPEVACDPRGAPTGSGAYSWRCTADLTDLPLVAAQGSVSVQFAANDIAGNPVEARAQLMVDLVPPAVGAASITYLPDSTNPVRQPRAAKAQTTVAVVIVTTEAIRPAVSLVGLEPTSGATISFSLVEAAANSARFEAIVQSSLPSGAYALHAGLTDLAGNSVEAVIPGAAVQILTRPSQLVVDQALVSFVRSPDGRDTPEVHSAFQIPAGPFYALAPPNPLEDVDRVAAGAFLLDSGDSPALLRVWANPDPSVLVGSVTPQSDGSWLRGDLVLSGRNQATVYVTGADIAGNEGQPQPIQHGWHIATTRPEGPQSMARTLVTSPRPSFGVAPGVNATSGLGADTGAPGDGLRKTSLGQYVWQAAPSGLPTWRFGGAMGYDSRRDRTVLFGGVSSITVSLVDLDDTWEFDGDSWVRMDIAGPRPPSGLGASMAYNPLIGLTMLYREGELWGWDGGGWSRILDPGAPNLVPSSPMVYDSRRGRMVLVGTSAVLPSGPLETWSWSSQGWVNLTGGTRPSALPSGCSYPSCWAIGLAYDYHQDQVLLFNGLTWGFDGSTWTQLAGAGGPSSQPRSPMVYDGARGRFGITADANYPQNAFWDFDGTSWTNWGVDSGGRGDITAATYDHARGEVWVQGGVIVDALSNQMLHLDRVAQRLTAFGGDGVPVAGSMTYDAGRQAVLLIAAQPQQYEGPGGTTTYLGTWLRVGAGWERFTAPPEPGLVAYDGARSRSVVVSGTHVREFVAPQGWIDVTPAGLPNWSTEGQLVYDQGRSRVVLVAPEGQLTIKEWTGTSWLARAPANPPAPRWEFSVAYDDVRRRVVVFGGGQGVFTPDNELLEWDGASWRRPPRGGAWPAGRGFAAMAQIPGGGRTVMFGGAGVGSLELQSRTPYDDLWTWDGAQWQQEQPAPGPSPGPRVGATMTYDPGKGRLVMVGGQDRAGGSITYNDTWFLVPPTTPEVVFHSRVSDLGRDQVDALRVRAYCGATHGAATGATLSGFVLGGVGSPPGAWAALATNSADAALTTGDGFMDVQITSGEEARNLVGEDAVQSYFKCRGLGGSGPVRPELSLDYMEVRVLYDALR
jgi:hypothetical protein